MATTVAVDSLSRTLDELLGDAAERGDVPGVMACVGRAGEVIYQGAFGRRVLGDGAPMTTDTVAWIASMTKAVTAAGAMQLVEKGELSLDTPASDVVPELADTVVLEGFDDSGQPRTRPPRRPITLRHLLTHTDGHAYEIWDADIGRFQEVTGTPGIISCADAALRTPLLADPGERWNYGIGIDWAGKMIEARTGKKLGHYLAEHLFAPLQMGDTAFKIRPDMRERMAKIHHRGEDGSLVPDLELELTQEPEFEMGGGGLYSTAPDYLRFVRMILGGGSLDGATVLRTGTVEEMCRNNMGDLRVTHLQAAMPPYSNDAEFFPGIPKSWGLSFQINEEAAPTGLPAGSLMWAGLANSYYWIDRANDIGGVYITQILPFCDVKSLPLFYDMQSAVYRSLT